MPTFGKVIGRFLTPVVDTADADTYPDLVPLVGTITFQSVADRLIDPAATPDATVLASTPIVGVLDSQGYLSTPGAGGSVQYSGLWLIASDDPNINPTDNQYEVTYSLSLNNKVVPLPSHRIFVVGGSTINLGSIIPPAAAEPVGAAQAEAMLAAITSQLGGLTFQVITQAAYNALPTPRPSDTLYIIN